MEDKKFETFDLTKEYSSLFKLVFLVYKDISKKWEKVISNWAEIISQLSIVFEDRIAGYLR